MPRPVRLSFCEGLVVSYFVSMNSDVIKKTEFILAAKKNSGLIKSASISYRARWVSHGSSAKFKGSTNIF